MYISKRSKNSFFLLFILSFTLFLGFPILALGQTPFELEWQKIDHSYLKVAFGDLIRDEDTANTGNNRLQVEAGGKFLNEFENLPSEDLGDVVLCKSIATFEFSTNIFTFPNIRDIFPYANFEWKNSQYPLTWLTILKFPSVYLWGDINTPSPYNMRVNSPSYLYGQTYINDIDLDGDGMGDGLEGSWAFPNAVGSDGTRYFTDGFAEGTFLAHDYFGNLPIELRLEAPFSTGSLNLNGYTFTSGEIASEFLDVTITDMKFGEIAGYQTGFAGQLTEETRVEVYDDSSTPSLTGTGTPSGDIASRSGGFDLKGTFEPTFARGETGQSELYGYTRGVDIPIEKINDNTWQMKPRIRLKPQIKLIKQTYGLDRLWYWWDDEDVIFSPSSFQFVKGDEKTTSRVIGVEVENQFIQMTFQVRVALLATLEKDSSDPRWNPDFKGTNLDDPFYERGDFIFDASIGGTTQFEAEVFDPISDILEWLFGWGGLIVMIIVIIVIIALVFFLRSFLSRGMGGGKAGKTQIQIGGLPESKEIEKAQELSAEAEKIRAKAEAKLIKEKAKLLKEQRKLLEAKRKGEISSETETETEGSQEFLG